MTKDNIFASIQKAGLTPVPVILPDDEDMVSIASFDGDLEQFLASAKAIGSKAVFVQDNPLKDENFLYDPHEEEDENYGEEIDLSTISPALAKFKKYLGQNYSFALVAKGGIDNLLLVIDQDWLKDFENEWERAQGKYLAGQSKARKN